MKVAIPESSDLQRLAGLLGYDIIVGFGAVEYNIICKLLKAEELTPEEEEKADHMTATLDRLPSPNQVRLNSPRSIVRTPRRSQAYEG